MMRSQPFSSSEDSHEEHTAYKLEILNGDREVILTAREVRPIHVKAVLDDDVAQRLIDLGYRNPQFAEGLESSKFSRATIELAETDNSALRCEQIGALCCRAH